MSNRVSPLHPTFGAVWFAWVALLIGYLWWLPMYVLVDVGFLVVFLAVELVAVFHARPVEWQGSMVAARDTFSQVMTWFARMAKPGTRWYQGWLAATVAIAGHVSWLVARQPEGFWAQQLPLWLLTMGFLVWHWIRPEKVG